MARKHLPTQLKILKGTLQPCRTNKNEPKPKAGKPGIPQHLDSYARAEWRRIVPHLSAMNLLTLVDRAALAGYCVAYSRWRKAEERLQNEGLVIQTIAGNWIQNPMLGVANKAMLLTHKFLSEFGLSPASRSKVSAKPAETSEDPWNKI